VSVLRARSRKRLKLRDLEAQLLDRLSRQLRTQCFEQAAFVVVRQLLNEHGAGDFNLEDAALQAEHVRLRLIFRPDRFGPGALEVQARLPPAPAARREQAGQDLLDRLRSRIGFVEARGPGVKAKGCGTPTPWVPEYLVPG